MTTIRKIVTSKVDGNSADSNDTNEIRPFGEIAVYLNTEPNPDKLTLMMFDGTRTHMKSKVLAPGRLYGSDADSGDGNGLDTIKLIPDASLSDYTGNDQYLIIDPTNGEPGHIHIRAGGVQDQSTADLFLGGEQTHVKVSDTYDNVVIRTSTLGEGVTPHTWTFDNTGTLTFPSNSLTIGDFSGAPSIISAPDTPLQLVSSGNNANTVLGWIDDLAAPTQQAVVVANNPLYVGEGDVGIVTGDSLNVEGGTGYIWNFTADGNLIFPDDTIQTTAFTGNLVSVSKFVMVNQEGTVWGSDDGENWSGPYDTGISSLDRVAVGPSKIVFIGNHPTDGDALFYASAWNSGVTLIELPNEPVLQEWRQVRYFAGIGRFIAVGKIEGVPAYRHSTDGITWTTVSLDTEWAGSLDGGSGYGTAVLTDVATNGAGFLFTTDNTVLGSFYTTTLTSDINIGENEWLNDGMSFDEVVYAASGAFIGWFAFGDGNTGAGDGWWYNDSNIPGLGSFVNNWGINDISQAFAALGIGYEPDWSELTIGSYNGVDTIVIATTNGQILYWPVIPDGPFVSIPKPYTNTDISISNASTAVLTVNSGPGVAATGEKITISLADPAEFNGVYYVGAGGELYTDIARTAPLDSTFAGGWLSGTVTFSHGQFIDALNYANGKFYVGNDDEEVFVSADGGATWTEVASLTGAPGEGEGLGYMNDVDGFVSEADGNDRLVNGEYEVVLGSTGTVTFPGGATVRDLPGEGPDDSVLILGAGTTIAENQRAARIGINGSVEGVSIGAGANDWSFTNDGNLTLPAGGAISNSDGFTLMAGGHGTITIGTFIETPGVDEHFHIAFPSSNISAPYQDLYLGDDFNFVKVRGSHNAIDHGVDIGANDRDGGSQQIWNFGTDGKLYLPSIGGGGGAILRSPLNESIGISAYNDEGAGTTYTLSVATTGPINIPTASTGLGRLQNADGIEILTSSGETAKLWAFGNDGSLTLPFDNKITVGGDMDSNSINFVLQDTLNPETTFEFAFDASMGMPLLRFPDDSLQSTAWTGGRVVTAPTASTGAEGDKQGDLAFTSSHLYYCIADYNQVGHQVTVATAYNGATTLNTNSFQLTKTALTLQITVGDIISDSDGGATSIVDSVYSDDNYTYVGTGGFAYNAVFPLTFTSTDYVSGGNIWKRVAWSGDTW